MRIVLVHNFYQQPGGEDRVFADEAELLSAHGHNVVQFSRHNDDVNGLNHLRLAVSTVWNRQAAGELERVVREHHAEVVHFHNTLPLLSPATYYAARRAGAAVVQTLHNYRLTCPKATLFRDGRPCELCLDKIIPWPAIRHACYRDNRSASAAIVAMLAFHRAIGTYRRAIDAYIALSRFSRDKLVEAGLPIEKMHLRANYMLRDPGEGPGGGGFAFYLGRLSPEKGVETLLSAWLDHAPSLPLVICGNGPMAPAVEQAAASCDNIKWYPNRPDEEVLCRLGEASVFVLPSTNYEGFPKTIVEAYAKGTPVVASRLGAMAELVREGISGACFMPGDAAGLALTIRRTTANAEELMRMRRAARRLFETEYSASANYDRLLEIYDQALRVRHSAATISTRAAVVDASLAGEMEAFGLESTVEVMQPKEAHDIEVFCVDTLVESPRLIVAAPADVDIAWPVKHDLFGVQVSATEYDELIEAMMQAATLRVPAVVSFHAVHAIVESINDPELLKNVNRFDAVAPDGQPVRWALNHLHGVGLAERVYGPEAMARLCERAANESIPIYLYGGSQQVIDALLVKLPKRFAGLQIAGAESPPFRALTPKEDAAIVERINESGAGIVFIGLGCPKQDHFAADHAGRIQAVLACVGAAFDFHAEAKAMAPMWMQRNGLEWLFRLASEPRRLWQRYSRTNSIFLAKWLLAAFRKRTPVSYRELRNSQRKPR